MLQHRPKISLLEDKNLQCKLEDEAGKNQGGDLEVELVFVPRSDSKPRLTRVMVLILSVAYRIKTMQDSMIK